MGWLLEILMSAQKHSRAGRQLRTLQIAACGCIRWSDGWVVRLDERACGFSHDICACILNGGFHCFRQRRGECTGRLTEARIGLRLSAPPRFWRLQASTCSLHCAQSTDCHAAVCISLPQICISFLTRLEVNCALKTQRLSDLRLQVTKHRKQNHTTHDYLHVK